MDDQPEDVTAWLSSKRKEIPGGAVDDQAGTRELTCAKDASRMLEISEIAPVFTVWRALSFLYERERSTYY